MPDFCPGYGREPFRTLVRDCPGAEVYPLDSFRVEWGPVFHRGRLDGSARILVIGQDPAQHETMLRRILVGRAGQRLQGFLGKLGIVRSYVMVNTFAYSVYGQHGGERHKDDDAIAAYRHRWLDSLFATSEIDAVIALGVLAERAWRRWKGTAAGGRVDPTFIKLVHPTAPEAQARRDRSLLAPATAALHAKWNSALTTLDRALAERDVDRPILRYSGTWQPGDEIDIPDFDVPAGAPEWMRLRDNWAVRRGADAQEKRRTIVLTVPAAEIVTVRAAAPTAPARPRRRR